MNITAKATVFKDRAAGPNSPVSREASTVAMESLVCPLIATEWPTTPAKSAWHKKKDTAEDHKAIKAAKISMKSTKAKTSKTLPETGDGPTGSQATMSTGSTVINCTDGLVSWGTPLLVSVYDPTGKIVAM